MIRYEVTLTAQATLAAAVEEWMRREHIPAILATRCFTQIHFDRSPTGFRTVYCADAQDGLDRYLKEHAAGFRADFQRHFPEGVEVSRAVWHEVERWSAPRAV